MYEEETRIANDLALIVSKSRRRKFTKNIIVTDECGGSLDVSYDRVLLHPSFFIEGNPVAAIEHVLDVSEEFDHVRERRTTQAIADLKHKLRFCLRELSRHDPLSLQKIIEEELGLGESDILRLEEVVE